MREPMKPKPRMITVRAAEGLIVFFPLSISPAPGRRHRRLVGEETVEVPADTRFVQRRIKVGDLVVVKPTKAAKSEPASKPKKKPEAETSNGG